MPYKDPAAKKERGRQYYLEQRERILARNADCYQRNREKNDARKRAYLAERPFLSRALRFANRANQRAAVLGASGKLFGRDIKMIVGPCVYCGGNQDGWDHVVPLSRGGANDISNLVPCCLKCNKIKATRTPEEWHR